MLGCQDDQGKNLASPGESVRDQRGPRGSEHSSLESSLVSVAQPLVLDVHYLVNCVVV